ncbi:MAG: phosphate/phosphite/phosphonate ABC transporter substrate-binding protein [Dehalococcoidia bacterium]
MLIVLSLITALLLGACAQGASSTPAATVAATPAPEPLVIAVQPTNTPEQLSADAKELQTFLSQQLNRPVEIVFPTTYAGVIEALRFGHADAALMSAWPLALAQKRANADVVLAEIREVVIGNEKKEAPGYYSYWVVKPDSPYQSLADLRGKRAALPSALSTSGYVAPLARLVELGLVKQEGTREADPRTFFGDVSFAGGYAQGWEALKAGRVDVTVIAGDVSESLYREVLANTRVIEQQGPVPSHGVAIARSLDAPTRDRLIAAFMELNAAERRPLMRKFVSGIFVRFDKTTGDAHLASLNGYLKTTQLEFVERLR